MDLNDPKEFDDPLVSHDPKGISIGIMDKETLEKLVLHNIVRLFASGDAKCLKESNGTFTFSSFLTNSTGRNISYQMFWFSFFQILLFFYGHWNFEF